MKIINELLAPVGSFEAVKVAISSGADAIYLAGKRFGARAFIANLSDEEIIKASDYVHLHNKKIYVTLNTLIFEDELLEVEAYIDFLYQYVDAIIVQDFGVIHYIRSKYPDFPVHISTQCSIHTKADVLFLKSLGVDRIVLAREVDIDEIKLLKELDIDLEVFIHGALCFCYSGLCYLSYYKGGRSGNRGSCAQPCRQNYSLLEDGKVIKSGPLLSMKDLNTISNIKELLSLGVTSLKVEGRAKSLEYLATSIRIYRKLIDDFNNNKKLEVNEEYLEDLYSSFSRERTKGYLFKENNKNITTDISVKHQGIYIGKVIEYKNKQIKIKLSSRLDLKDGIRIISKDNKEYGLVVTRIIENGNLVKSSTGTIIIDVKNYIEVGSNVYKTSSNKVSEEVRNIKDIKDNISTLDIYIKQNKQILTFKCEDIIIKKVFDKSLQKAKTINNDNIINQFKKVNNLPIIYSHINISNIDNLYISIPEINEMRKILLLEIEKSFINRRMRKYYPYPFKNDDSLFIKDMDIKEININFDNDLINMKNDNLSFHLSDIKSTSIISPYLGVNNHYAVNFFRNLTKNVIILSYECTLENAINLSKFDKGIGFLVEYYEPLMVAKHCVVAKAKGYDIKGCKECLKHQYQLLDEDRLYDLKFNNCIMYIKGKKIIRNNIKDIINVHLLEK